MVESHYLEILKEKVANEMSFEDLEKLCPISSKLEDHMYVPRAISMLKKDLRMSS